MNGILHILRQKRNLALRRDGLVGGGERGNRMKTVAMDIVFEGEDAERLRYELKRFLHDWRHGLKADMEVTSWDPAAPPLVLPGG